MRAGAPPPPETTAAVASPSTLSFELFPARTLRLALFRDVSSAAELAALVAAAGGGADAHAALIDASALAGTLQVRAAAQRALHNEAHASLRTNGLHSELVYALHPSRNIGHALKMAGVRAEESERAAGAPPPPPRSILVAAFDAHDASLAVLCSSLASATRVRDVCAALDAPCSAAACTAIAKRWKLSPAETAADPAAFLDAVVTRMATGELK